MVTTRSMAAEEREYRNQLRLERLLARYEEIPHFDLGSSTADRLGNFPHNIRAWVRVLRVGRMRPAEPPLAPRPQHEEREEAIVELDNGNYAYYIFDTEHDVHLDDVPHVGKRPVRIRDRIAHSIQVRAEPTLEALKEKSSAAKALAEK